MGQFYRASYFRSLVARVALGEWERHDHRIPFMLKLAGQKSSVEYDHAFNTILTRELLLKLLRGEMKTPSEVVEWIERNSPLGESSLTVNAP